MHLLQGLVFSLVVFYNVAVSNSKNVSSAPSHLKYHEDYIQRILNSDIKATVVTYLLRIGLLIDCAL